MFFDGVKLDAWGVGQVMYYCIFGRQLIYSSSDLREYTGEDVFANCREDVDEIVKRIVNGFLKPELDRLTIKRALTILNDSN